jgi:hypothetical protein
VSRGVTHFSVNGTERTDVMEWDAQWEERLDGVGQASVTVQDRSAGSSTQYGDMAKFTDSVPVRTTSGWRDILKVYTDEGNLFWGEVSHSVLKLPAGFPWRRWEMTASDFNTVFDLRLVGVPDGSDWETIDGGQTHQPIDEHAHGESRDGDTVAALFLHYVELPRLVPSVGTYVIPDTTTFVRNWIPAKVMIDPHTGKSRLQWSHTTLRSAMDEMRQLAAFPIFYWIDPDLKVHWEAVQDYKSGTGGTLIAPHAKAGIPAPAVITDDTGALNGSTVIGGRNLQIEYDSSYAPQQVYINGVTDFIYNGGNTIYQGTGWALRIRPTRLRSADRHYRQTSVDAETVTDSEKSSVAHAYQHYGHRPRLRGQITVGKPDEAVDGWRVGQMLTIHDARLPPALNGKSYPIQRVQGKVKAGWDYREYTLEFGDFPIARFSQKYRTTPQRISATRLPARKHRIYWPTHHLRPSTSYVLRSQMVDHSDKPVRRGGIPVVWSVETKDRAGVNVGGGTISAHENETDDHGRTAATLTTASGTDLHYHVTVKTPRQE